METKFESQDHQTRSICSDTNLRNFVSDIITKLLTSPRAKRTTKLYQLNYDRILKVILWKWWKVYPFGRINKTIFVIIAQQRLVQTQINSKPLTLRRTTFCLRVVSSVTDQWLLVFGEKNPQVHCGTSECTWPKGQLVNALGNGMYGLTSLLCGSHQGVWKTSNLHRKYLVEIFCQLKGVTI